MNQTLFVKYSSERQNEYRFATSIILSEGKRFVKKVALTPEARDRLTALKGLHADLKRQMNPNLGQIASITEIEANSLTFEYLEGHTVEEDLHKCVDDQDKKRFLEIIDSFWEFLNKAFRTVPFETSEEFSRIFPTAQPNLLKELPSFCEVTNLDMNFDNLILSNGAFHIFDLDWILSSSVPVSYIFYRSINSFYQREIKATSLFLESFFYHKYHLNKYLEVFLKMESDFQKYAILQERNLQMYAKKILRLPEILQENDLLHKKNNSLIKEVCSLEQKGLSLENQQNQSQKNINSLQESLQSIYNSRSWKLICRYKKLKGFFIKKNESKMSL